MFEFNRDYKDLAQVEEFLPAFERVFEEVKRAAGFAYNDDFKGRIPGIEGPNEDTAIYLLQNLRSQRSLEAEIAELEARGFTDPDLTDGTRKYAEIVVDPNHGGMVGVARLARYREARLIVRDGEPYAILPKGKRTCGYRVEARRVLVSNGDKGVSA